MEFCENESVERVHKLQVSAKSGVRVMDSTGKAIALGQASYFNGRSYPFAAAKAENFQYFCRRRNMKKYLPLMLLFVDLLMLSSSQCVFAQSDAPKLEAGVQYSLLRLKAQQPFNNPIFEIIDPDFTTSDSGFGGRITSNLTDSFSLEGEVNYFPEERQNFSEPLYINSKRTQGLFGVKYGKRSDRAGIFAKARPGFMHFGPGTPDPRIQTFAPVPGNISSTEFAMDIGGVLEFYPSRHTMLRFDVGDTIIRYGTGSVSGRPAFTTHNLQLTVGAGFRF